MNTVIKIENLSKLYKLGRIDTGSLIEDLKFGWAKMVGRKSIFSKVGTLKQSNNEEKESMLANNPYIWALKDINFDVSGGDIMGIIGKNGAGKSTILKILSNVTAPTTGTIKIRGRIASLLEVGTGFHPELTGRENIFLNGAILGMTKTEIKSKFNEIVDFSGVEQYIDTPVKRYSSGMYVRLAFAVAAHLEPEILILDEVLAVGDFEFQKKCLGKVKDVSQKEGRTVLFVSHNLSAVINLCNKAILLDKGNILINGPVNEVIQKYCNTKNHFHGKRIWNDDKIAPGSENVKLHSVTLISNGIVTDEIDIQDDFIFEFDYWNFKPDIKLTVFFHITDTYGTVLLSSGNLDSVNIGKDEWFNKKYPIGLFKTNCFINRNFLNVGTYSINLAIQSNIIYHEVFEKEILTFDIVDKREYCKEYNNVWPGFIRPKLKWNTKLIEKYK